MYQMLPLFLTLNKLQAPASLFISKNFANSVTKLNYEFLIYFLPIGFINEQIIVKILVVHLNIHINFELETAHCITLRHSLRLLPFA